MACNCNKCMMIGAFTVMNKRIQQLRKQIEVLEEEVLRGRQDK